MTLIASIVTLQQRVDAANIISEQREAKTSSEASRRCNRQRVETWHAEQAHTEHALKTEGSSHANTVARGVTRTMSSAAQGWCATYLCSGGHEEHPTTNDGSTKSSPIALPKVCFFSSQGRISTFRPLPSAAGIHDMELR